MAQQSVQLTTINEQKSLSPEQQQEIKISAALQTHLTPRPDLLTGSRKDYVDIAVPLYEASLRGDWKAAKEILDKRRELVRFSITENGETPLHVAASAKSTKHVEEFVQNLMEYMQKTDLELENNNSNTALCLAAAAGNLRIVKILVEKNPALVAISNSKEMPPLYMAALFNKYEVTKYLYDHSKKLRDDCWSDKNRAWLLAKCVETEMFDIALDIVKEYPALRINGTALAAMAPKTDVFAETETNIIVRTINSLWTCIRPKVGPSKKENKETALELLIYMWKHIAEMPKDDIDTIIRGPRDPNRGEKPASDKEGQTVQLLKQISLNTAKERVENRNTIREKFPSRIIFTAAKMGNTRFIIELIRLYPDLIWKVNDSGKSIFHIAIKHRHEGIYKILYEIGSMKDLITPMKDHNGNYMLHLVGKSANKKRLHDDVSGVAFQMQRELLWFQEVQGMIPLNYRDRKNKDGLTPHQLFTKEHKELVKEGKDWMINTASQCMVVAALIATIVFAAAFTVPGGYNQNDGIPIFYQKATFITFVVSDAISLFSSSASILMFLSILTSRYAEQDFLESLPKKLLFGLMTLFLSITTMMVAFSVSFFVLYHRDLKWIPILIAGFAAMPVLLFAKLQYPLLKDVFYSTYASRYLFRPKKHVLYNEDFDSTNRWFPSTIPFISKFSWKISKKL